MCFIALVYKVVPEYPVIVAANRDEFFDRPSLPPGEIRPGVWAGSDGIAGGTWLGINRNGLVVAVANVMSGQPVNPQARSRGLLCLDLLALRQAGDIPAVLKREVADHAFNGFNLLAADRLTAGVGTFTGGTFLWREFEPGVHVIGNSLPDSTDDPKVLRGKSLISPFGHLDKVLENLSEVCRDHGIQTDGLDAICVHGTKHGTRSSTILALPENDPTRYVYRYAEGSPCRSNYQDQRLPFGLGG